MIAYTPARTDRKDLPTASIIIPVFNQMSYTRQCLDHLMKYTEIPFELIIIDNASTDGTAAFLCGVRATVLTNATNRGCAGAWNQGIAVSQGQYVVLLNNDVLVTPGWLEGLVAFMAATGHGIVSPAVREGQLNYDLLAYAEAFTRACARATRPEVTGCCMVIAREVFERVGLFDEEFHAGTFEDIDFLWRARRAAVTMAMTGAVLVHHFGQVTQREVRQLLGDYGRANASRFVAKWGRGVEGGWFARRAGRLRRFARRAFERFRYGHTLIEVG
jgi:GT2 family glycosyltransferase